MFSVNHNHIFITFYPSLARVSGGNSIFIYHFCLFCPLFLHSLLFPLFLSFKWFFMSLPSLIMAFHVDRIWIRHSQGLCATTAVSASSSAASWSPSQRHGPASGTSACPRTHLFAQPTSMARCSLMWWVGCYCCSVHI